MQYVLIHNFILFPLTYILGRNERVNARLVLLKHTCNECKAGRKKRFRYKLNSVLGIYPPSGHDSVALDCVGLMPPSLVLFWFFSKFS